jgi:hypothetical protein
MKMELMAVLQFKQTNLKRNEFSWLVRKQNPFIKGVVGWVDLIDENLRKPTGAFC